MLELFDSSVVGMWVQTELVPHRVVLVVQEPLVMLVQEQIQAMLVLMAQMGLEAMQVRERQQVEPLGCLVTGITLMAVLVFITTGTALIMLPTMAMRALTAQDMEAVKVLLATQEMPGQTVQRVRLGIQEIQEMLVRMVLAVLAVLLY
jgi:hypothetical protein